MSKITIIIEDGDELVEVLKDKFVTGKTGSSTSDYSRYFDEKCPAWSEDPEYNLLYLKHMEQYANSKLKAQGYLFLNDVYEMLGMLQTNPGQVVGWIYDEKTPYGDNYVDFGIYTECNQDFIKGIENTALLNFNVGWNIARLPKEKES